MSRITLQVLFVLAAWFAAAMVAGANGWVARLHPPGPQILIFGLLALLLGAVAAWRPLRVWLGELDVRLLVLLHATRFVGVYFLLLYSQGQLPWAFAVPGGIGDIIVAAFAVFLCFYVNPDTPFGRRGYIIWNVFGLLDILFVISTATRLGFRDVETLRPLLQLPLSLLPTFIVPLILFTHALLVVRLWQAPGDLE